MARPVTTIALFFLSLTLFSTLLSTTGVAAHLGLNNPPDSGDAVSESQSAAEDVSTGAPTGETLFGAYNVLSNQLASILGIINPGLRMLYNAGVPAYIAGGPNTVGFLPSIATFVQGIAVISFFRGWGL